MKKLLFIILTFASLSAFGQTGSLSQSVYRSRVNDSTTVNGSHTTGYSDIYYNRQKKQWRFWDHAGSDSSYQEFASKTYVQAVVAAGGGGATAAGATGNVQFKSAGGGLQAEAALSYDSATNTLDADIVTVNAETYGSGWNGDNSVPTKNDAYDGLYPTYPTTGNHTTNYTAAMTDANSIIEMESASAITMTVPPQSSVTWLDNTMLTVINYGSADVTLTQGSGVTFRNMTGTVTVPQYGLAVFKRKASDEWYVFTRDASNNLASGIYTPTLTNSANISASTTYQCTYMRVGNAVTVSGHIDIDPTTTATLTTLGFSIPIASAFSTADQAGGTGAASGVADAAVAISSDPTNDRITFQYVCTDVTNHAIRFSFTYQIL